MFTIYHHASWVFVGRTNFDISQSVSFGDLYVGQIFVDMDFHNADQMASHNFWSWGRVSSSRFREDNFLVNCDACEILLGSFRIFHLMISVDGCSEDEEGFFCVIAYIIMSRDSMVFVWTYLSSSSFIPIVASSSDLATSIFPPTLFLTFFFSSDSSNYVASV